MRLGAAGPAGLQTLHTKLPCITPRMTMSSNKEHHGGRMALMMDTCHHEAIRAPLPSGGDGVMVQGSGAGGVVLAWALAQG